MTGKRHLPAWTALFLGLALLALTAPATALEVNITPEIDRVEVRHGAEKMTVARNQEPDAVIEPEFARTSRKCPPFCAQPMEAAPGVATIGEVELIEFMRAGKGLVVDARTPDWHAKGTLPGAVNVPYSDVTLSLGADDIAIGEAMKTFGVGGSMGRWDFTGARTLALFCNGPWCGQSPTAIRGLLELGYPVDKLLYYRGGMQTWKIFGLPTPPPPPPAPDS